MVAQNGDAGSVVLGREGHGCLGSRRFVDRKARLLLGGREARGKKEQGGEKGAEGHLRQSSEGSRWDGIFQRIGLPSGGEPQGLPLPLRITHAPD